MVNQANFICQALLAAGVLILSEFTGASQSLGAGAILVNPWNITDLSAAIGDALTMTDAERRERHRQNYMHISIHTSQTWADTFISELNDTHVEAELRTKHIPPQVGSVAVLCCAALRCAALWSTVGSIGVRCWVVQRWPMLCCAMLCCAILPGLIMLTTTQRSIKQHSITFLAAFLGWSMLCNKGRNGKRLLLLCLHPWW